MNVCQLAIELKADVLSSKACCGKAVNGVYVCDLLSRVMSHAAKGDAWVTVHAHLNVVAVAVLTEVVCVIVPEGIAVDGMTLEKAESEGVVIISSPLTAYEICCCAGDKLKDR